MNPAQIANARTGPAKGDTRTELLAAASELMIERDSVDISLADIANRAKSNVALVKYYFGNKEGLLLALVERDVHRAIDALTRLIATDMPAVMKMRHHVTGLLRTYHRYPYLNRLVRHVIRDSSSERAKLLCHQLVQPICDFYEKLIAQGVVEGSFRKVDPMLLYFSVVGACDQMFSGRSILKALFGLEEIDDDLRQRYIDHTVALLTQGLALPADDSSRVMSSLARGGVPG